MTELRASVLADLERVSSVLVTATDRTLGVDPDLGTELVQIRERVDALIEQITETERRAAQ